MPKNYNADKKINAKSISSLEFSCNFFSEVKGYFFWYLKKRKNKESIFYSKNIEDITGYTAEEISHLPGRMTSKIFHEDSHKIKKLFTDFVNNPSQFNIKLIYRVIRKDEKIIWIEENVTVKRDSDGNAVEYYGIVCDITSYKEGEEKLSKVIENLKELNSFKDRFISVLSHDLRAPFTSILGFSEILMNEPNLTHKERQEYLTYINDSSQHQLMLINYLLDWSRLQTGRIKIEPQRLNAQSIVYNCVSSLTGNAIRKNIDIKVNINDGLFIQADERLIAQVITNLLSNAIKFSNEGKMIEISADVFNEKFLEFVVKDEGTGISKENKAKLFKIEKMFSVEGTKGEKGTGLGLSLVKEIVEKHGGEIWFYSEVGKGSEFHFTVPSSQNTILIVDGDYSDLLKYEKIIKEEFPNFNVVCVKNGYEALTKVSERLPSLIIADYDMPLMNGFQLIEFIRKEDKNFKIPIIATTSNLTQDLLEKYQHLGIDFILQKPIDEELFCSKIETILEK